MNNDIESTNDDLRMLYQVTVSDLTYFKTQQWAVTNYALALIAALIGITQFIKPSLNWSDRVVLVSLLIVSAISSLYVLSSLQKSIKVRQSRLKSIRSKLSESFLESWGSEPKGKEHIKSVYFLYGVVVASVSLSIWLIGFRL